MALFYEIAPKGRGGAATGEAKRKPAAPVAGRPRRRLMRNGYFRALTLFLALGLVAHFAVAIGCAVAAQRHFNVDKRHRQHMWVRASHDWDGFQGATMLHGQPPTKHDAASWAACRQHYTLDCFGYHENRTSDPFIDAPPDATWYDLDDIPPLCSRNVRIESGWPMRSLCAERDFVVNVDTERNELERGQFPSTTYVRAIPITPMPGGFVVNTILYSAAFVVLYSAILAPGKLRRRRRIRRGLCPACAYPVGGSSICTECGRNLP